MQNALTIDVEDYFQVTAFNNVIKSENWPRFESRVERNTLKVLSFLSERHIKATFFVLGWVTERYPTVVKEIQQENHEIACHGYDHKLIYDHSKDFFRKDIRRAKVLLEDITGEKVVGYRAPSYSIVRETLWALEVLKEEGFEYDSSIFPINHDKYGIPDGNRFPHQIDLKEKGKILEIPPSTIRIPGRNLPIAGGGYLRLFPYRFLKWGITRLNHKERQPAIIYFHPWELDPEQPKINGTFFSRFRHYINLGKTEEKLEKLVSDFEFGPLKNIIEEYNLNTASDTI